MSDNVCGVLLNVRSKFHFKLNSHRELSLGKFGNICYVQCRFFYCVQLIIHIGNRNTNKT